MDEKQNIDSYLRNAKEKYTYFLLAASVSAIAFAVSQTKTLGLAWSQIPLAVAVLLGALSFFFGCKSAQYHQDLEQDSAWVIESNNGFKNMPETKEKVIELLSSSYGKNLDRVSRFKALQFYSLVAGGTSFLLWHIVEMYLRTGTVT